MMTAALTLIRPSSIANSGGTASIVKNGKVTFAGVTSLSLNGVFSATYDNYLMVIRNSYVGATSDVYAYRLRASGTDASGANYTNQEIYADSTTVGAGRGTSQTNGRVGHLSSTRPGGNHLYLYGPYLAAPTATRTIMVGGYLNAYIDEFACTHSLSTSYDGITIYTTGAGGIHGALTVYGLAQ